MELVSSVLRQDTGFMLSKITRTGTSSQEVPLTVGHCHPAVELPVAKSKALAALTALDFLCFVSGGRSQAGPWFQGRANASSIYIRLLSTCNSYKSYKSMHTVIRRHPVMKQ